MNKFIWLIHRLRFALAETPRRWWRLLSFGRLPFYRFCSSSPKKEVLWTVKKRILGLLVLDALFFFDLFEIVTNFFSPNTRLLTAIEKQRGQMIFGNQVNFKLVMLDKRSLPIKRKMAMAYVLCNTVHSWRVLPADVLVHEFVHVWQYQHFGAGYIAAALFAQTTDAGYNYTFKNDWAEDRLFDLNAEQMADFIQDYYRVSIGQDPQWQRAQQAFFPFKNKLAKSPLPSPFHQSIQAIDKFQLKDLLNRDLACADKLPIDRNTE
jgi:hypothetical protein